MFTLYSFRFFLLVLRVLLEVLRPLQTGWEHGSLLWLQAWCWAGAMEVPRCPSYLKHALSLATLDLIISCFDQEPLLFTPQCVPWPSFLCACGCRRPREGRLRKLHFHSVEATREGQLFWDQASWSKSEITPCAIKPCHWDGESKNFAAILQPRFNWGYHLVYLYLCTLYNMML